MAEVFATMFQDEALVVRSLLESAGISAEIASEHFIDVYPIFFPQSGGIKIVVQDEDADDALAIVESFRDSKRKGDPEAEAEAEAAADEDPGAGPDRG
jgi:hypothetical protein